MEEQYRQLLLRRVRVIPVRQVFDGRTMGSNESVWPRRENADAVHNRGAVEVKTVKDHIGVCDGVNYKDALYKDFC